MSSDLPLAALLRRGAPWVVGGQLLSQFLSLASLAFLYRLVEPEAFGLFGMALPFVMLPRTMAILGLSAAAVQRHELSNDERSLIFWMQFLVGVFVTAGTWLLARPAALLYGVEEVAPLVRALAATVLVASLSATHQALLERQLQLARVTIVRLVGQSLGIGVAIYAAWHGWQAQALVVQQYGELLALLAASWLAHPWWPGVPRSRQLAWRELAAFGGFYSLSSLVFVLVQNVDKLLLGLWLGHTPAGQAVVGAYSQAYNLMMRPVYLVSTPLSGMLLPALSRAAHNASTFAKLIEKAFGLAALLLLPASVGLWLVAVDLMVVLGGDQWYEAGVLLGSLAPIIAVHGWINLCGCVLAARGRSKLLAFGAVVMLLVVLQAVAAGYYFGQTLPGQPFGTAHAVAWALSIALTVVLGIPYIATAFIAAGVKPSPVLMTAVVPLRHAMVMGMAVLLVSAVLPGETARAFRLAVCIATGVGMYALLAWPQLKRLLRPEDGF